MDFCPKSPCFWENTLLLWISIVYHRISKSNEYKIISNLEIISQNWIFYYYLNSKLYTIRYTDLIWFEMLSDWRVNTKLTLVNVSSSKFEANIKYGQFMNFKIIDSVLWWVCVHVQLRKQTKDLLCWMRNIQACSSRGVVDWSADH